MIRLNWFLYNFTKSQPHFICLALSKDELWCLYIKLLGLQLWNEETNYNNFYLHGCFCSRVNEVTFAKVVSIFFHKEINLRHRKWKLLLGLTETFDLNFIEHIFHLEMLANIDLLSYCVNWFQLWIISKLSKQISLQQWCLYSIIQHLLFLFVKIRIDMLLVTKLTATLLMQSFILWALEYQI